VLPVAGVRAWIPALPGTDNASATAPSAITALAVFARLARTAG
jgi:hypothetical protein